MKQFYCGAVVPDCDATFTAATEDEILEQVAVHAREVHGMEEEPAGLVEQVRGRVHEVA